MDGGVDIGVLGEIVASSRSVPADLGGRQRTAVLGLLVAARGESVPAGQLLEHTWRGNPTPAAISTLRAHVSRLRSALQPDAAERRRAPAILTRGTGYALEVADDAVDAWRFERLLADALGTEAPARRETLLREGLELWRGPAYGPHADEAWAEVETGRLGELREVARDELAAARLAQGESSALVAELESLVAATPLREERWRLLVLAQYRANRQGDALATLRRVRATLADELGVDPGPGLLSLEADVLAQAPGLQVPSSPVPVALSSATTAAPGGVPSTGDLVDRDGELAELRDAVADAVAGRARCVVVEGPAGIGKTRLLSETRRVAVADGARVLFGRGSRLEREYGFGLVRQLLEDAVSADARLLDGPAAAAGAAFTGSPLGLDGGPAVTQALYRVVAGLAAAGPLVLAVDDVQWADAASLRFLVHLLNRMEALPVLLVASLRTGEEHAEAELLDHLRHDALSERVAPGPLSRQGVADLVDARLGPAAASFVEACHRTTSGNPLLLRQLLRALQSERVVPDAAHVDVVTRTGSRAVSSLVLSQLARLPAPAAAVAAAVAVLGPGAELPVVARLAERPEEETGDAVAALARAEILRYAYPLSFVHPLGPDAVYADLAPGRRQLAHARAARILDAAGAPPESVAAQLMQVPPDGDAWVVGVLRLAAARARERAAPEAAVTLLRRALVEPPSASQRAEVLLELGQAEAISEAPASIDHLREAYDLLGDPEAGFELALTLGRILVFVGEQGSAAPFARAAQVGLPDGRVDERQALVATERIAGYLHDDDPATWRTGAPEVSGTGPGARMLAVALAWEEVMDGRRLARALDLVRFGIADGSLLEADTGLLWVVAGHVLDVCDDDAAPLWAAGLRQSDRRGDLFTRLGMQLWRGWMLGRRGELREARHVLTAGNEMSRAWGRDSIAIGYGEAMLLEVLLEIGDLQVARAFLEQIAPSPRHSEAARMFGDAQARLLLLEGRFGEALRTLDETAHVMDTVDNPAWRSSEVVRAGALAGLGRLGESAERFDAEVERARRWGAPRTVAQALRRSGSAGVRLGRPRAAEQLREALDLLDRAHAAGAPGVGTVEQARCLVALAGASSPADAEPMLRRAARLAGLGGADALRGAADAELVRLGAAPPAPLAPASTLSATEVRAAQLSLAGHTEHEIADQLWLTPRSVRAALDAVHALLDAPTPGALEAALAAREPVTAERSA